MTTKKFKEDTDVEKLHTNAVKVVFKERKLDHVYHFMDTTTQKKSVCLKYHSTGFHGTPSGLAGCQ